MRTTWMHVHYSTSTAVLTVAKDIRAGLDTPSSALAKSEADEEDEAEAEELEAGKQESQ